MQLEPAAGDGRREDRRRREDPVADPADLDDERVGSATAPTDALDRGDHGRCLASTGVSDARRGSASARFSRGEASRTRPLVATGARAARRSAAIGRARSVRHEPPRVALDPWPRRRLPRWPPRSRPPARRPRRRPSAARPSRGPAGPSAGPAPCRPRRSRRPRSSPRSASPRARGTPCWAAASSTTPRAWPTANAVWTFCEKNSRSTADDLRAGAARSARRRGRGSPAAARAATGPAMSRGSRSRPRAAGRRSVRRSRSRVRRSPGRCPRTITRRPRRRPPRGCRSWPSPAGRRRGPRASRRGAGPGAPSPASSSTVCLAIIVRSADSTGTPAPSSAFRTASSSPGRRVDLDRLVVVGVDVLGAGVDRGQRDLVGVDAVARRP